MPWPPLKTLWLQQFFPGFQPDIVGTNPSQLNQDTGQSDGSGIPTRPSTAPKKLLVEENTAGQEVEMVIQPTHQPLPHHGQ